MNIPATMRGHMWLNKVASVLGPLIANLLALIANLLALITLALLFLVLFCTLLECHHAPSTPKCNHV